MRIRSLVHILLGFATIHASRTAAQPGALSPGARDSALGIVAARCLSCHDSVKKTAGIDLSLRSKALESRSIVPNDPSQSRLIRMVAAGKMPPTGRLNAQDVNLLRDWIGAGAPYVKEPLTAADAARAPLWSFQAIQNPPIPKTPFDSIARNPIDRFIFSKLAERGLHSSPSATRLKLLRRVTIDLTGLPPTPEEIDAFLKDTTPNAYERVVDRLLASPGYGERWARHWLDVVRFGESNGYEQNHLRSNAWPYRDYVIRAFNEDKPFERFIVEQLAGDVVGKGDPKIEPATGFLVAGVHDTVGIQTEEGTRQQRSNDLDDMVATTGAAFLGLTVGCARCHDHKFDPILQRDYYRLTACFAGVRHGDRTIGTLTPERAAERARIAQEIVAATNEINSIEVRARESILRVRASKQGALAAASARPAVNARVNVDEFPAVTARFIRFTVLATRDNAQPCLDEMQVYGPDGKENLALASVGAKATASSLLPGFTIHQVAHLNDGKFGNDFSWISSEPGKGWAQIELANPARINRVLWSRDAGDIPRFDDRLPTTYRIAVSLDGEKWQTVSTEAGRAGTTDYIHPDELVRVLSAADHERRGDLLKERESLKARASAIDSGNAVYAGVFTAPDPTFVLRRGDVMQRADEVTPGALSYVTSLATDLTHHHRPPERRGGVRTIGFSELKAWVDISEEAARRLALAQWITDPKNPLTARVIVNRVWQHHFGRGIVGTPSDFGRNGEKPTHPELLDWLATDFMNHGWSLKRLHRIICLSYTYQQTSHTQAWRSGVQAFRHSGVRTTRVHPNTRTPKHPNIDPSAVDAGNQLLWRMPLQRMEAEAIRDAILQTSSKLDRRMGGPGYRLYKYTVVNVSIYEPLDDYGPETWRRSIYAQAARAVREDLLGTFDCPESSQRAPRRDSTTTALQALTMLHGPFLVRQSRFFAERVAREAGPNPVAQVDRAFQLALGHPPTVRELSAGVSLAKSQGIEPFCRALLNANEFLYY